MFIATFKIGASSKTWCYCSYLFGT